MYINHYHSRFNFFSSKKNAKQRWSNNNNNKTNSNQSVIIFGYKWWGFKVQTLKIVKDNLSYRQ